MARGASIAVDGHSTTHQNGGAVVKSKGSHRVRCDLDQILSWWELIRPIDPTPEPIPTEADGTPYRLCSGYERGSHYAPRRAFAKHKGRRDGLETECRQCRHERDLRLKVTNFTRNHAKS